MEEIMQAIKMPKELLAAALAILTLTLPGFLWVVINYMLDKPERYNERDTISGSQMCFFFFMLVFMLSALLLTTGFFITIL